MSFITVMMASQEEAVENFREYLKIQSVHPDPDYDGCVRFLEKKAKGYGLKTEVIHLDEKRPVLIITLEGTDPSLPTILLNSHMDVVPVFKEEWTHEPFGAEMDSEGNIYARGAQDMKCVTIAQLEALSRIKSSLGQLKRTVHMSILPDEEIGGKKGMAKFVHTQTFKDLNVGFDIDEGIVFDQKEYITFSNERCKWGVLIHCPGTAGHGSLLLENTAGEKLRIVIDQFMDFRKKEEGCLKSPLHQGDITTVNLTEIKGGVQNNVVPAEIVVGFDMRIKADGDHEEVENWINDVCKKAGEGVYPEYTMKDVKVKAIDLDSNPFWKSMVSTFNHLNLKYYTINCVGTTDARFVRGVGIAAVGFSAFNRTEVRLHANDEYLNKDIFLKGISIYETLIRNVANV